MRRFSIRFLSAALIGGLLCGVPGVVPAQAEDYGRLYLYAGPDDYIFGFELMSVSERDLYRRRMHNARTWQERERIRSEHRALMLERARERGLYLAPPPRGHRPGRHGGGPQGWR